MQKGSQQRQKDGTQNRDEGSGKKIVFWVALFAALFAAAYVAINVFGIGRTSVYMLDGMRIESEGVSPKDGLVALFSKSPQIVRIEAAYNATGSRNEVVTGIAAEVISGMARANRTVSSYVAAYDMADETKDAELLNCNENNSQCGTPTVIVLYGSCNCLRILSGGDLMVIEGDDSFLGEHLGKLRGVIGLVMAEIANKTAAGS